LGDEYRSLSSSLCSWQVHRKIRIFI
jgi:hypothetical protein